MIANLSNPLLGLAPQLSDPREIARIADALLTDPARFDLGRLGMDVLKSFAILVGRGEGGYPQKSGDRLPEATVQAGPSDGVVPDPSRVPEARYAYYRRCQQFRRNGEQCKAPAMKGEQICHRHAEQADMERRRQQQRREILSRPGAGLGSVQAIQRTISELLRAILARGIDRKAAGRLLIEIQAAIRNPLSNIPPKPFAANGIQKRQW